MKKNKNIVVNCEFTVTRGDTDVTLIAPFLIVPPVASRVLGVHRTAGLPDVEPTEGGFAKLDGDAFCVDEYVYYELTVKEQHDAECEAYEKYWLMT